MDLPLQKIKPYSHEKIYKKGEGIFFQGETPKNGVMISDGFVRSYAITTAGDERTVAFFTTGDILPLSWLMGTTQASLFYYQALTDVTVQSFSHEHFLKYILNDNEVVSALFHTLSSDLTAAMIRINGLEQSRADEKIAFTLYYLVFRYGHKMPDSHFYKIAVTMRHATIASLVGLSRESTTKILIDLQRRKLITYKNGTYCVDKIRLEKYIGEDSFRDISL